MAKAPRLGAVKTRLAAEVGGVEATRFARRAATAVILRLAADRRWTTVLAVAPDQAACEAIWPRGLRRVGQGRGDLGTRMQRLFDRLPPGPAAIVGTDIPRLGAVHVAQAFRLLGSGDAVLGPAGDGGYWLVGLRRSSRRLSPFAGVRWSSPHALADTRANLAGRQVLTAALLDDVDDAASLRQAARFAGRVVLPRA